MLLVLLSPQPRGPRRQSLQTAAGFERLLVSVFPDHDSGEDQHRDQRRPKDVDGNHESPPVIG